ncbi:MAG: hypothetical protein H0X17_19710, partial [Deltaproteobacteria bacterium]|nr:hypothetical protein [Deltaproteobacteria bacterium]
MALYAIAATAGLTLILPLLGYLVSGSPRRVTAVLGMAGLGAVILVGGALVLGFLLPRRRYADDAAVARWVGTRHRAVASDLLSA